MSNFKDEDLDSFWQICEDTHSIWLFHKTLFDLTDTSPLFIKHEYFFHQIYISTWTNTLLSMGKLFDSPDWDGKPKTMCLEYAIKYGSWSGLAKAKLKLKYNSLSKLKKPLKEIRDQYFAHNDIEVEVGTGAFDEGMDIQFFKDLYDFMDIMYHEKKSQKAIPFSENSKDDVESFLNFLKNSQHITKATK